MIQSGSRIRVIDNSGATFIECICVLGKRKKSGRVGDKIVASVKSVSKKGEPRVKVGDVVKAVIAQTKYKIHRSDGTFVNFSQNGAFILKSSGDGINATKMDVIPGEVKRNWPNLPAKGVL